MGDGSPSQAGDLRVGQPREVNTGVNNSSALIEPAVTVSQASKGRGGSTRPRPAPPAGR
ncbi:MAG: hypothetical protein QHH02_09700 [Syntrophomonadaceae bacterium]|nr:hypothetical protein [Syntrophomonadaceae bacterium]